MKKLSFSVVALIASIVMLTSCLGNGGSRESSQIWGYIEYNTTLGAPLLYTAPSFGLPVYSSALKDYVGSDIYSGKIYVQAYVEVESTSSENLSASGFYYANISNISRIEDSVISQAWLDTTSVKTNEIPSAIYSGFVAGPVNDIMFFNITFDEYQLYQENDYFLTFDENQEPGKTSGGDLVFDLYLRAVLKSEGKGDIYKNQGPYIAVNIQEIRDRLKRKLEGNYQNGYELLYFRINTVKGIDKETGERTGWVTSDNFYLPVFPETN